MSLFLISLLAGFLTVLAPCILPLLPIVIGRSVQGDGKGRNPYLIIGALALSVILFTLLLKASTALIDIPTWFWTAFSGTIILFFGLTSLFPALWTKFSSLIKFQSSSEELLQNASEKKGVSGDIALGFALGPVFTSCSPTYFIILGVVLPEQFSVGLIYLAAYTAGLCFALFLVAFLGRAFVQKVKFAADPNGWFKKALGVLFIIVGIGIILGWDKDIEAFLVDQGYSGVLQIEEQLLEGIEE